jgi:hypothetical protein
MSNPTNVTIDNNNGVSAIQLDGNDASIRVGSHERAGSIYITAPNGQDAMLLNGRNASLTLGGNAGQAGNIVINDRNGSELIKFDGLNGDFIFGNANHHGNLAFSNGEGASVSIDAGQARLSLGGSSTTGEIHLSGPLGENRIDVSAANSMILLNPPAGSGATIKIDASLGEITVGTQVFPDYVFSPDWKLQSLPELACYIAEQHRLPGFPSANEVRSNGMDLVGTCLALVEKIEELTLHAIALEKRIAAMENLSAR